MDCGTCAGYAKERPTIPWEGSRLSFFFYYFIIINFFLATLHGMENLSSMTRDQTCIPCIRSTESFLMSQPFVLGGQSIGTSESASVLSVNIQD